MNLSGDDNEGKCMDNFAYVGASDGLCRPWHRKISDQHGQRYGRKISRIIQSDVIPYKGENHGEVISRVSSAFLGTPYQADTLIGGLGIPEVLVANFNGVDCFTTWLITLKPWPAAIIRNRFCIILPGLATPRAKLLISAAGTSSLTGSPQHRVMHGM